MTDDNKKIEKRGKGYVYCIRSYQTDNIYIGSCFSDLRQRLYSHRTHYKKWLLDKKNYISSFDIIKYDDHYIELIETYENVSKKELNRSEGEKIRSIDCVNKRIAGRTVKEYYKDNIDELTEYKKDYYNNNKSTILKHKKEHYNDNKKRIIDKNKKYYADNRVIRLKKQNEYNLLNKDKIHIKIECEHCKKFVSRKYFKKHLQDQHSKINNSSEINNLIEI